MNPKTKPYQLNSADAPAYWQMNILWIVLASGEQTGGSYTLLDEHCPANSGPPPHFHDQDETITVLDGEITFLVEGETIAAKAGSFVWIPRGAVHSFRVDSATARILNSYTPGGFDRLVTELGEPAQTRAIPPAGRPMGGDKQKLAQLSAEIGMHGSDEPDSLRAQK